MNSPVLARADSQNVSNHCVALVRFQIGAVRHVVHDLRPVLAGVFPHRGQGVTFNAAMNEKCPAVFELANINILFPRSSWNHLLRHRRRVIGRFAANQRE